MQADTQAQVAFFLTGRRTDKRLEPVEGSGLRPALFARYNKLTELRYDFPLVLVGEPGSGAFAQSLSDVIDKALAVSARGADGERIRKNVLSLEREIRALAAAQPQDATSSLSALWDRAAGTLALTNDQSFQDNLRRTRAAIRLDGAVLDCNAALPVRLVQHAWAAGQRHKALDLRKKIDTLVLKLSNILKSDYERSEAGRSAKNLQAGVGSGFDAAFDFGVMSRLLSKALPKVEFPQARRARISALLEALTTQQFIPASSVAKAKTGAAKPYGFLFESCADALSAFRERVPKQLALARAIAVAELEVEGLYSESKHDSLFAQFGSDGLDAAVVAAFPDYLVCVNAKKLSALEQAHLTEILSSGLPIKVLLQIDDILGGVANAQQPSAPGVPSRQIASMAIGLGEAFVLQTSSSNLLRLSGHIADALNYAGPALLSVFSGAGPATTGVAPYMVAAAAVESRAFPSFTYNPSAGPNWASRFRLDANPQSQLDWPVHAYEYEDPQHQRVTEDLAFTLVDFLACDQRYAGHLARIGRDRWNTSMIAAAQAVTLERTGVPEKIPTLLMVDAENVLHKVIVDEELIRQSRRCRLAWQNLQELGGIHNSHAEILLAREKKNWEASLQQAAQAQSAPAPAPLPASAAAAAPVGAEVTLPEPEPERSADEAYIETARCSTCNECTQINGKMFSYNANQQAYIADITAGTYAQLVEAAESCQVSVIHPGKPRDPNEPGLEDLLKRAEAFA